MDPIRLKIPLLEVLHVEPPYHSQIWEYPPQGQTIQNRGHTCTPHSDSHHYKTRKGPIRYTYNNNDNRSSAPIKHVKYSPPGTSTDISFNKVKTFIRSNKWEKKVRELTVNVQIYLFIILYFYWIETNIIQYLLYLVVLVYEYMSVFTELYLRKCGQLLYERIMQPSLEIHGPFIGEGGTPIWSLSYGATRSDWLPSFCRRKNQFVSITFSSRDTWT